MKEGRRNSSRVRFGCLHSSDWRILLLVDNLLKASTKSPQMVNCRLGGNCLCSAVFFVHRSPISNYWAINMWLAGLVFNWYLEGLNTFVFLLNNLMCFRCEKINHFLLLVYCCQSEKQFIVAFERVKSFTMCPDEDFNWKI